jgi:uncharacterized membrane protein YgdD (TMEM256/DUF423 family)
LKDGGRRVYRGNRAVLVGFRREASSLETALRCKGRSGASQQYAALRSAVRSLRDNPLQRSRRASVQTVAAPIKRLLMDLRMLLWASVLGGLGVALGAFGAHALRRKLDEPSLALFETGVRYQMYHALALFGIAAVAARLPGSGLPMLAGWCFVAGTLLFSGSLYVLAIGGRRAVGAITPIGGLLLVLGWMLVMIAAVRALTIVV